MSFLTATPAEEPVLATVRFGPPRPRVREIIDTSSLLRPRAGRVPDYVTSAPRPNTDRQAACSVFPVTRQEFDPLTNSTVLVTSGVYSPNCPALNSSR